jgi:hypothetical protein
MRSVPSPHDGGNGEKGRAAVRRRDLRIGCSGVPGFSSCRTLLASLVFVTTPLAAPSLSQAETAAAEVVPSLTGSAGLLRVSTAEVGEGRALALAVRGGYARSSDLIVFGDVNQRVDGVVSALFAPHAIVEIFGAAGLLTNHNRGAAKGGGGGGGTDVTSTGTIVGGAKLALFTRPTLRTAAEIGVQIPTDVASLPASASAWADLLASFDLAPRFALPLRWHVNAGFYQDNSGRQLDVSGLPASQRQLEAAAHGVSASRVRTALGIEALFHAGGGAGAAGTIAVRPFAEFHVEIVTAAPDPAFLDQGPYNRDQQWLTLGCRARIHPRILVEAGLDLVVRPIGFPYGPPRSPYTIILGAAVPFRL